MEKIRNVFLYAGVTAPDYERIQEKINETNRILVDAISGLASLLITFLFILSYFIEGIGMNHIVYGIGSIISLICLFLSLIYAKRYPRLIMSLVHTCFVVFFTYGILIGAVTDPDEKTVTFMVMLVLLPALFIVPPYQMIAITVLHSVIFVILCFHNKTGAILNNDIVDTIVFGFLGMNCGFALTRTKIKSYIAESKLQELSRIDALTGMNSRNAYEYDIYDIPKQCKRSLTCIYVDVNGLKTINDTINHTAGDKMLKAVAEKILKHFGEVSSYRIGGDEFVIFASDFSEKIIEESLESMKDEIEECGYHVATGYETRKKLHLNMADLQKAAEMKMYQDKATFYKNNTCFDRRKQ